VLSNLHYGYVGKHYTLGDGILLGSQNLNISGVTGRRDPADDVAVAAGFALRDRYGPGELQSHHVEAAILNALPDMDSANPDSVQPRW
jgi:hypothetical protein